jgi:hypothetical protein
LFAAIPPLRIDEKAGTQPERAGAWLMTSLLSAVTDEGEEQAGLHYSAEHKGVANVESDLGQ